MRSEKLFICLSIIGFGVALVSSVTANAGDDQPASEARQTPTSSGSAEAAIADEPEEKLAPDGQPYFLWSNQMSQEAPSVKDLALETSKSRVTFIVWGGNNELQAQAYEGAKQLAQKGVPVAMISGPDLDGVIEGAHFSYFSRGVDAFDKLHQIGSDNVHLVRPDVVAVGKKIHNKYYAPQVSD